MHSLPPKSRYNFQNKEKQTIDIHYIFENLHVAFKIKKSQNIVQSCPNFFYSKDNSFE